VKSEKGFYPIGTLMEVCGTVPAHHRAKIVAMRVERHPHRRPLHIYKLEGLGDKEFVQGDLADAKTLDVLRTLNANARGAAA